MNSIAIERGTKDQKIKLCFQIEFIINQKELVYNLQPHLGTRKNADKSNHKNINVRGTLWIPVYYFPPQTIKL